MHTRVHRCVKLCQDWLSWDRFQGMHACVFVTKLVRTQTCNLCHQCHDQLLVLGIRQTCNSGALQMVPQVSSAADGPVTHGQTYVSSEEIWITIRSSLFSHIRFTCIHVCTGMQSCVKIHCHGTDFKPFMPALLSRNFLEHRHTICAIGATINSWFLASGRLATVEHSKQVLSTPKDCCLKDLWWVGFNTYMSWPWETRLCGSLEIWIDRIDVDIFVLLLASFLAGKLEKPGFQSHLFTKLSVETSRKSPQKPMGRCETEDLLRLPRNVLPEKRTCPLKINGWFRCISYWKNESMVPFEGTKLSGFRPFCSFIHGPCSGRSKET